MESKQKWKETGIRGKHKRQKKKKCLEKITHRNIYKTMSGYKDNPGGVRLEVIGE